MNPPTRRGGLREATGIRRAGFAGPPRLKSMYTRFRFAQRAIAEGGGEENVILSPPSRTSKTAGVENGALA